MTDITWTCADFFCGAGGMVGGYEAARAEMAGVRGRFKTLAVAFDAIEGVLAGRLIATNERCGARTRRICTPEQVA